MNLSPALADRLREQGHDAIHVVDIGDGKLPDGDIFERAADDGRVLVTLDLDFGEIFGSVHNAKSGLILLRLKLVGQSHVWDRLQQAIGQAAEALETGAIVLVEDARIRIRRMGPEE